MQPQTNAQDRDKARGPRWSVQPYGQIKRSTLELVHSWTDRTNDEKKKKHHTCKHVLMPGDPCWMCSQKLKCSRAELEKRRLSQLSSTPRTGCSKKVTAQTAANGWTSRRRLGETRNMANCFTLLQRITKLKCVNSAIRSKGQKSYLERYSRRGSRHLVEPTWVNTLAQNCHVEFWCGMHLTCKNTKN